MTKLSKEPCTACRADSEPVTGEERSQLLTSLPEWGVEEVDSVPRLVRTYKLKDFVSALAFTEKVGEIAEQADHHPSILTEWGKVTVSWWTHKIRNLHMNDFIMAARTDEVYNSMKEG